MMKLYLNKASPYARLVTLRKCGLGRGLIDVAFGAVIQQRYAAGADPLLRERWRKAVDRTIAALDKTETLGTAPDLGDLTIAVALSYIDLRMREVDWRAGAPRLRDWYPLIECRKSMKESAP